MFSHVLAVFYVIATIVWLIAIVLLIKRVHSARAALRRPPDPHAWPMRFPFWFASRGQMRFLLWLAVLSLGLIVILEGIAWALDPTWERGRFPLLMALWGFVIWLEMQIPHICTIGDDGICVSGHRVVFFHFRGLIPWECIRRSTVEPGRLLMVIERPGDRAWIQHVEIPLADLPESYRPVLQAVLKERTVSRREPATVAR